MLTAVILALAIPAGNPANNSSPSAGEDRIICQRETPRLNSHMPCGYCPVNSTTHQARNTTKNCAIERNQRQKNWGISRNGRNTKNSINNRELDCGCRPTRLMG